MQTNEQNKQSLTHLHTRDGFDNSGLSMSHMTNGS